MRPHTDYFVQKGVRFTPEGATTITKGEQIRKVGIWAGAVALAVGATAIAMPEASTLFHDYAVQPFIDVFRHPH